MVEQQLRWQRPGSTQPHCLSLWLGFIFETPSSLPVVFKGASEMNCGGQKFVRRAINATHVQQIIACPRLWEECKPQHQRQKAWERVWSEWKLACASETESVSLTLSEEEGLGVGRVVHGQQLGSLPLSSWQLASGSLEGCVATSTTLSTNSGPPGRHLGSLLARNS